MPSLIKSCCMSLKLIERATFGNDKELEIKKCVIVINHELPVGVIANTAAVLSINLGKMIPEIVGLTTRIMQETPIME